VVTGPPHPAKPGDGNAISHDQFGCAESRMLGVSCSESQACVLVSGVLVSGVLVSGVLVSGVLNIRCAGLRCV
jgi:hypothetical protein